MKKIALATIFYNNSVQELQRLVTSVPDKVIDTWIWVDGIFKYTKEQNPELPDITPTDTIIDSIGTYSHQNIEYIFYIYPNSTEFEKRNAYLEVCEKLDIDVLIIVDTDEYFEYEPYLTPEEHWQRFKKHLEFEMQKYQHHNVFGINYVDESGTKTYKPRIWVNPGKMRYIYGSHYHYANVEKEAKDIEFFKTQNLQYCQQAQAIVKGLTLKHDHNLRSKEYQERREQYQKYLVKFESLVQSHKYTSEEAHKLASENPDIQFKPT